MVVRLNRIVSIFVIDTAIDTRSIDTRDVYRKCSSDSFTFFFFFFVFTNISKTTAVRGLIFMKKRSLRIILARTC